MPVGLLAGAFEPGSLGDEAVLEAFVRALPGWRLAVTTPDRAAAARHGCEAVDGHRAVDAARWAAHSDAVIIGGGSPFSVADVREGDHGRSPLVSAAALVTAASVLARPVAMIGVGTGRLTGLTARALARSIVRHADLLVLRDEASVGELVRAGVPTPVRVGADPTWTLLAGSEPERPRAAARASVVMVPSRSAAGVAGVPAMVASLAETVNRLTADGIQVQMLAWRLAEAAGTDDDLAVVDAILRSAGRAGSRHAEALPTPASLPEAASLISSAGSVLSFHFHPLVAASASGVPWVAVSDEASAGALADQFGQRALPAGTRPATLAEAVIAALETPGPTPSAVRQPAARAEEGFRLLRVLLARGHSDEADGLGALPLVPVPPAS